MRIPAGCRATWPRLVLGLAAALLLTADALAKDVTVGVFAFQGERAADEDWSPVLRYLNEAIPDHRFSLAHYDAAGMRAAIAARRVDLVITNPGYYVTMEAEFGLSRLATLESPHAVSAGRALGSVVIARRERTDLREFADLADKTLAAVAPDAFGGYLLALRELAASGADKDIKQTLFVGLPMVKVIEAVAQGRADAGIVRACLPEQLAREGRLRLEDFRVLAPRTESGFACALSTRLYPDWPIATTRHTDPALAKAVALALLAMPEVDGGLRWSVPADYQPVHDLYRELRLGPYADLHGYVAGDLLRRFWPWLTGFLLLIAAWIVHTVRVEHLVQRRTAELSESLAAREAAEARMRSNQERMEHLSRLSVLGELSSNLAHEINQPLTSIGTYANTVLRRQAAGALTPEAVVEACTEIAGEAERAGGIVQRIRHFARKHPASRDPVDVGNLAAEARHLIVGMLAKAPSIGIDVRTSPDCQVLADGRQIQQVLLNLIKNAIDAARDLPADRQHVDIRIETAGNRLLVHVVDRGIGLDEEQRRHLFEPFFTTKPEGLGLGLPICKTIIEAHGGRLWAEPNAAGPGMSFSFSLPCHEHSA